MIDGKAISATAAYTKALTSQTGVSGPAGNANDGPSFAELVKEAGLDAINSGQAAEKVSLQSLTQDAGLAEIVTAVSNAEASLETVVAVRDRVIQAYQDIIKMPI